MGQPTVHFRYLARPEQAYLPGFGIEITVGTATGHFGQKPATPNEKKNGKKKKHPLGEKKTQILFFPHTFF